MKKRGATLEGMGIDSRISVGECFLLKRGKRKNEKVKVCEVVGGI